MDADVRLSGDGARVDVTGDTDDGLDFVDRWCGPIVEVVDSGRIAIPAEAVRDFLELAEHQSITVTDERS